MSRIDLKQEAAVDAGTPALGKTAIGVNEDGQVYTKQHDGTVDVLAGGGDVAELQAQIDALDLAKAPKASPTFTGGITVNEGMTVNGNALFPDGADFGSPVTLPSSTTIGGVSSTEIGYLDGVTGAIQTQLDAKAPLASPALTGVPSSPTASPGTNTTQIATTAFVVTAATDSAAGVQANLTAHIDDLTGAHAGTAISNTPAGGIAATTVQGALNELDTEKADSDLSNSGAQQTLAAIKPMPLRRLQQKIASISSGTSAQFVLMPIGDSLGRVVPQHMVRRLIAQIGFSGWYGRVANNEFSVICVGSAGGGATTTTSTTDFTVTPTGDYVTIAGSGQYAATLYGTNDNSTPFPPNVNSQGLNGGLAQCNTVRVGFIGGAGTGTFKVQVTYDRTNWADSSITSLDASTYPSGNNHVTGTITEGYVLGVRAIWISGTTKIYSTGAHSTTRSGTIIADFSKPSIQIGSDGFAGGAGTSSLLAAVAPDLVTVEALDGTVTDPNGTGGIGPAIVALNTLFNALSTVPEKIYFGVNSISANSYSDIANYNYVVASKAYLHGAYYEDSQRILGDYNTAYSLGFMADETHPNSIGGALICDSLPVVGALRLSYGQEWTQKQGAQRNLWIGDTAAWPNGISFSYTSAGSLQYPLPGLICALGGGYNSTLTVSRVTLDQVVRPSISRYGINITQTSGSVGASLYISAGPARRLSGKQATISFWAIATGTVSAAMFWARYAGTGSTITDGNRVISFGTTWQRYQITADFAQLLNAEQGGSQARFAINMPTTAFDLTITDVEIVVGPIPTPVIAPRLSDTFIVDLPNMAANGNTNSGNLTMLGISPGQKLKVNRPPTLPANVQLDVIGSSQDTIIILAANVSGSSYDPASLAYVVTTEE